MPRLDVSKPPGGMPDPPRLSRSRPLSINSAEIRVRGPRERYDPGCDTIFVCFTGGHAAVNTHRASTATWWAAPPSSTATTVAPKVGLLRCTPHPGPRAIDNERSAALPIALRDGSVTFLSFL